MPAAQQQQHEPPHHHHHQLEHGTPSTLGKRGSGALALARAARALFFFQHEFSRLEQHGQRRRLAKNSVLDSAKPRQDFSTLTHTLSCCTSNRQHSPAESVFPGGISFVFPERIGTAVCLVAICNKACSSILFTSFSSCGRTAGTSSDGFSDL